MNLFGIALKNIKINLSNYFLYFASMACSIVTYFTLKAIQYNKQIIDMSNLSEKIANGFSVTSIVILLFVAVFIGYSNAFFAGRRKREVALYCLLGVKKSQIARMLFYENLVMGSLALFVGIFAGVLFSRLFAMILVRLMGFDIQFTMSVPLEAVLNTVAVFLILFIITSLHGYSMIYRFKLIDLFKSEKIGEKPPRTSLLLTSIAFALIGCGYWRALHYQYDGLRSLLTIVVLTVVGTYLLFSSLVVFIVKFYKKDKFSYYKGLNMISASHLLYRSKSNAVLLATVAILGASAISAVGASAAVYYDQVTTSNKLIPWSYVYQSKDIYLDQKVEKAILKYPENKVRNSLLVEINSVKDKLPVIAKYSPVKGNYEDSVDNVISESTQKKILASMGRKAPDPLKNDEMLMYLEGNSAESINNPQGKTMYYIIGDKEVPIKIKECVQYPIINKLFNGNYSMVNTIVVNDEIYAQLNGTKTNLRLIKIDNAKKSKRATEDVYKTMRQSRLYDQNSIGQNALTISVYYEEYTNGMAECGMTIFLMVFLGLIFLVCTGSIIFFKQLAEANVDRDRYEILKKIGVTKAVIKSSIAKQMGVIFGLPIIVGVTHSLVALQIIQKGLTSNIVYPVSVVLAIYGGIYLMYFLLTVKYYCKILDGNFVNR